MIELDIDQLAAIDRMVNEPTHAALNASQYGTGKTVVTVEVGERLGAKVKVIVCPLFTKYSWKNTIQGQYPEAVVKFVNSSKAGREALAELVAGVSAWYVIGREYFRSKSIVANVAPISPSIDFLAYDECAAWANHRSQGFRNMMKMKPKYRMALSATPQANKFDGLYAITHWLWPKYEGHNSYWKFVKDHCKTEDDYWAGVVVKGEKEPGSYVSQLPCYVRLEKDFGDPIELTYEIDLSAAERRIYDKFEKYLIVWLQENPLVAKFPITKRIRLRQMSLGEVSVDEDENVFFELNMRSSKYEALKDVLDEYNEPAIIFTDSAKYAEIVAQRLMVDDYKAIWWTGNVPENDRHLIKQMFEDGDIDYIVATIASIGEGVDGLQHRSRLMVWLSKSDNNMLNMQAFRRLFRRGQERRVVSIDIVARDTYDSGQLSKLIQNQLDMNEVLRKR